MTLGAAVVIGVAAARGREVRKMHVEFRDECLGFLACDRAALDVLIIQALEGAVDGSDTIGQELEAQQAELQTTENRYSEVKMWLDSFAEHSQSGDIMNADDSMIMKQLVEQIIVGDDGIEVHFKCGIVASHEYM